MYIKNGITLISLSESSGKVLLSREESAVEISEEDYTAALEAGSVERMAELKAYADSEVQSFVRSSGGRDALLYAIAKKLGMVGGGLTPAGDIITSDNFQDGNGKAPFNLQVRNTTGEAVEWVAVVSGVQYSEIPDLKEGDYSLEVGKDDDGYVYTFSGKLGANAKIEIAGSTPSPAGTGSGLELFIKEGS